MTDLLLDLRYAFRSLMKTPGFTVVTVLVLGLGIGANTAVFSVVNAVLLQPLPVDDPDRLAVIWSNYANSTKGLVTPDDYRDIRDHNRSFQTLAAYTGLSTTLTGKEGAEMIRLSIVTSNLFTTLGARPAMGRAFSTAEDEPGQPHTAILSYGLWQRRFGGDAGILGRAIEEQWGRNHCGRRHAAGLFRVASRHGGRPQQRRALDANGTVAVPVAGSYQPLFNGCGKAKTGLARCRLPKRN